MRFTALSLCLPLTLVGEVIDLSKNRPASPASSLVQDRAPADVPSAPLATALGDPVRQANAFAALRSNRADEVEQLLIEAGLSTDRKSAEAQQELAMNWLRIAFQARSAGDIVAAQRAATRALRAVERAENRWAGQPDRLAELQLFRATLMEEFIGTTDDAEAHVLEAVRLDASNPVAQDRQARLERRRVTPSAPLGAVDGPKPSVGVP